ncbi:MAG: hypothetical protein JRG90_11930 [Deltaproteobacteria bacterium]|nr:hypothetical protein [Deltaproteobacteria bacterium]
MSLLSRISVLCVSLAYLTVVVIPCAMSESIVTAATTDARDTASGHSRPAHEIAETHAGNAHQGEPHPNRANHAGHAGHAQHPNSDTPALHQHVADAEPAAQLSAPCSCGCSDSPDSAGNSSVRIGFALPRAGWARALGIEPLRHAATVSQPPQAPHLALDPVPG